MQSAIIYAELPQGNNRGPDLCTQQNKATSFQQQNLTCCSNNPRSHKTFAHPATHDFLDDGSRKMLTLFYRQNQHVWPPTWVLLVNLLQLGFLWSHFQINFQVGECLDYDHFFVILHRKFLLFRRCRSCCIWNMNFQLICLVE